MKLLRPLLPLLAAALVASSAHATIVTYTDTSGVGGSYSLDVVLKSGTTNTYIVTLAIDLNTSPLLVPATTIEQVDFKIANSYASVSFTGGSASISGTNWTENFGPLMGTGCNGVNGDFVCLDADPAGLTMGTNTTFSWTTEVTLAPGVSLNDSTTWHIGARYASARKPKGWIVSLPGAAPPIPEPTGAALFGVGALLAGAALRSQRRR